MPEVNQANVLSGSGRNDIQADRARPPSFENPPRNQPSSRKALPYICRFTGKILAIKYGGYAIRSPALQSFVCPPWAADDGMLDTGRTFRMRDANAFSSSLILGGCQGWDITNVDISLQLLNGQTQAVAQDTTTGDTYVISDLGLQIEVGAPVFPQAKPVDETPSFVGNTLTYSTTISSTVIVDATNVVFTDPPSPGTTFVPGSFKVNGAVEPPVVAAALNRPSIRDGKIESARA